MISLMSTAVPRFASGWAIAALLVAATPGQVQAQDGAWINQIIAASKAASPPAADGTSERTSRAGRIKRPRPQPATANAAPTDPALASLTGSGITWQAASSCVPGALRGVLSDLVGTFGPVIVTSTCRGRTQNRTAGGAGQSYHLTGEAVDFRVRGGSTGAVYAYLASNGSVGGLKHYGGGLFHIDTGPRRSW